MKLSSPCGVFHDLRFLFINCIQECFFVELICIFGIHFLDTCRELVLGESLYERIRIEVFRSPCSGFVPDAPGDEFHHDDRSYCCLCNY